MIGLQVKNNKPIISVMMNGLNSAKYLGKAIDSVYAQSFTDWEIIFWDNDSDDESINIAESYDSKIKIFKSKITVNLGQARYDAVKQASGEYLAFLDCDDVWLEKHLETQLKIFQEGDNNLGMVYGRSRIVNNNLEKQGFYPKSEQSLHEGDIYKKLCKGNFIPFVSSMVSREKYFECGEFPKAFKHSTDYYLFLNISKKYKVKASSEINSIYRIHDNNLTHSNRILAAEESIKVVSHFLPDLFAKKGLRFQYLNLAVAYFRDRRFYDSLRIILSNNLSIMALKRFLKFFTSN